MVASGLEMGGALAPELDCRPSDALVLDFSFLPFCSEIGRVVWLDLIHTPRGKRSHRAPLAISQFRGARRRRALVRRRTNVGLKP